MNLADQAEVARRIYNNLEAMETDTSKINLIAGLIRFMSGESQIALKFAFDMTPERGEVVELEDIEDKPF